MKRRLPIAFAAVAFLAIASYASAEGTAWFVPRDFPTIQAAIDSTAVVDGDTIFVGRGSFAGAVVNKSVAIVGRGRTAIVSGPLHPAGLVQGFRLANGSSGATIANMSFSVDLGVFVATGDDVNEVTVTHCTFTNALQAISAWGGSGWNISHNDIHDLRSRNGGGIGILIGDWKGRWIADNTIHHNRIDGTLHVAPDDLGGYNGTGIVVYADYRWGRSGANAIVNNRIFGNTVSLTSDTPAVVDVAGIELTDTRDIPGAIYSNFVVFNDLRGTAIHIDLSEGLDNPVNTIFWNLGENRGHGGHRGRMHLWAR